MSPDHAVAGGPRSWPGAGGGHSGRRAPNMISSHDGTEARLPRDFLRAAGRFSCAGGGVVALPPPPAAAAAAGCSVSAARSTGFCRRARLRRRRLLRGGLARDRLLLGRLAAGRFALGGRTGRFGPGRTRCRGGTLGGGRRRGRRGGRVAPPALPPPRGGGG